VSRLGDPCGMLAALSPFDSNLGGSLPGRPIFETERIQGLIDAKAARGQPVMASASASGLTGIGAVKLPHVRKLSGRTVRNCGNIIPDLS
jgi:hypothetical protein